MNKCDMCGYEIKDGRCSCSEWKSEEQMKDFPIKKSLEAFHEMDRLVLTGDAPHLGCAVVFFRGDYNDCEKVRQFILFILRIDKKWTRGGQRIEK